MTTIIDPKTELMAEFERPKVVIRTPEEIDYDMEVAAVKPIIEKYEHFPDLLQYQ